MEFSASAPTRPVSCIKYRTKAVVVPGGYPPFDQSHREADRWGKQPIDLEAFARERAWAPGAISRVTEAAHLAAMGPLTEQPALSRVVIETDAIVDAVAPVVTNEFDLARCEPAYEEGLAYETRLAFPDEVVVEKGSQADSLAYAIAGKALSVGVAFLFNERHRLGIEARATEQLESGNDDFLDPDTDPSAWLERQTGGSNDEQPSAAGD